MRRVHFEKYQGLGNDFLVVQGSAESAVSPEQSTRLCDRNFGVGGDGVLLVLPPRSPQARATMIVLNADGSRPEMCGNGLRCVALHLARSESTLEECFVVDTDAGPKACRVEASGDVALVTIDLGRANIEQPFVFRDGEHEISFARVSTGNPHAIVFGPAWDDALIDRVGPAVCKAIVGGANVEFVSELGPDRFKVVVWERGVGRTLACGTGAAAVAAAAAHQGRASFGKPIEILLPGGPLQVTVEAGSYGLTLRGPAAHVFTGEAPLP